MNIETLAETNRRTLMARALMLMGAAAVPLDVAFAAASARPKRFLTADQFKQLEAVADTILPATDTPGALGAGVPAKLDGMLTSWASADTKTQITGALARIDAEAIATSKKGFAALSDTDRAAVLRPFDAAALKPAPRPANAPKGNPLSQAGFVADNGYLKLKDLIVSLYYSSEIAMTKELIYEHVPGVWQPSIKITETSRPWASTDTF